MLINYIKSIIYTISILLISTILVTILNYFNVLTGNTLKIIHLIIPIISIIIGSYKLGKKSNNKGYIEGLKYGILFILLLLIFNLISKSLSIYTILYMIILLLVSTFSSILGINKKK